ncbi:MAG: hypothetical protein MUF38_18770 [Anaerolineae bacterium]|jgi:hypothetical protein|nr:hypothetical protein [Anaerolineae bacterium]
MRGFIVLGVILLALGLGHISTAQEESPSENACYAGGAWEGKCDWPDDTERTEWAWTCGHYYARVLTGRAALTNVPVWCGLGMAETVTPEPFVLCVGLSVAGDLLIQGAPNQLGNTTLYAPGSGCSGPVGPGAVIWMQTSGFIEQAEALAECNAAAPSVTWMDAYQLPGTGLGGFNFVCYEIPAV